ncbi:hypothetical protein RFI_26412 [Reticulomyxa filosa]|uniref:Uncharacterized protein n=1 Tax=Reticulomyxa filosa TaxID=46433 RepID=X6MAU0_RETFI|nr:hypothetical protein RFI_26412 [Reticulomyxa filosa]|eukprot:ETO10964.1 hypothetical protein RFI_26412 [Reticulomyxa filosa]
MIMSHYTLLNHLANYMWKCGQYLTFCYNMAKESSMQISSKKSMQLKNNIIRILQSTFVNNAKQSKNNLRTKTLSMNNFRSASSITQTTYKLKIKAATFRVLRNSKAEAMIQSNTASNIQKQVLIGDIVCYQLFWYNVATNKNEATNTIWKIYFQHIAIQSMSQFKLLQTPTSRPKNIVKVRLLFCPMLQC